MVQQLLSTRDRGSHTPSADHVLTLELVGRTWHRRRVEQQARCWRPEGRPSLLGAGPHSARPQWRQAQQAQQQGPGSGRDGRFAGVAPHDLGGESRGWAPAADAPLAPLSERFSPAAAASSGAAASNGGGPGGPAPQQQPPPQQSLSGNGATCALTSGEGRRSSMSVTVGSCCAPPGGPFRVDLLQVRGRSYLHRWVIDGPCSCRWLS